MVDVSIVMPCLNERISLPHCIANAHEALKKLREDHGWAGEIVIADNGSNDGSQDIAEDLGARVVHVAQRGYGSALMAGFAAARGRYLVMGDSDGSYDFCDAVAMVVELSKGADLCMGSRFKGGIAKGAMPWKNRYIGNPALTGLLNLFYGTRISDSHCGLRALTRRAFETLRLQGDGMEFASEMVVKAALNDLVIRETPATLSPDLRDRPPHLRPWRDGWRHLRLLLLLCPTWLFLVPAIAMMTVGVGLLVAPWLSSSVGITPDRFGASWTIFGGALTSLGYQAFLLGYAAKLLAWRNGWGRKSRILQWLMPKLSLNRLLAAGLGATSLGITSLIGIFVYWTSMDFRAFSHVWPVITSTTLTGLGLTSVFFGFVFSLILGSKSEPNISANAQASPVASAPRTTRAA
jgi:glycosyltransferase involved in cell wall biosynthesis